MGPVGVCSYYSNLCHQSRWGTVRRTLIEEAGCRCQLCGREARTWDGYVWAQKVSGAWKQRTQKLTLDHIIPQSLGGLGHRDNLWVLCSLCNRRKSHYHPREWSLTLTPEEAARFIPLLERAERHATQGCGWVTFAPPGECQDVPERCQPR